MTKQRRGFLLPIILMILSSYPLSSQSQDYRQRSLFSDYKAQKVGDILTIAIVEQVQASNTASNTEETRAEVGASASAGTNGTSIEPNLSINTTDRLRGSGETTRREIIRARLSARVIEVDENGNLKIQGTRTTTINGETQTITITGLVRPADIEPDNTVYSTKIADMVLTVEGNGTVSQTKEPGLITKFLRLLF